MSTRSIMAEFTLDALSDFMRCCAPITEAQAIARVGTLSPVAWTAAHVGQHIDSWVNVALARASANQVLRKADFGKNGNTDAADWRVLQPEITHTVESAARWLESATD